MTRSLLTLVAGMMLITVPATVLAEVHITTRSLETRRFQPESVPIPCDGLIRYDDGSDDTPTSGPTLGWFSSTQYQNLGVVFTPPAGQDVYILSAGWFSDFWVNAGLVDVTAYEFGNPGNRTTATVFVSGGGSYQATFGSPITIPANRSYMIAICPRPGVYGVVGDDWAAPDRRSAYNNNLSSQGVEGCAPTYQWSQPLDFMIWSCATPNVVTAVRPASWGRLKTIYR